MSDSENRDSGNTPDMSPEDIRRGVEAIRRMIAQNETGSARQRVLRRRLQARKLVGNRKFYQFVYLYRKYKMEKPRYLS